MTVRGLLILSRILMAAYFVCLFLRYVRDIRPIAAIFGQNVFLGPLIGSIGDPYGRFPTIFMVGIPAVMSLVYALLMLAPERLRTSRDRWVRALLIVALLYLYSCTACWLYKLFSGPNIAPLPISPVLISVLSAVILTQVLTILSLLRFQALIPRIESTILAIIGLPTIFYFIGLIEYLQFGAYALTLCYLIAVGTTFVRMKIAQT